MVENSSRRRDRFIRNTARAAVPMLAATGIAVVPSAVSAGTESSPSRPVAASMTADTAASRADIAAIAASVADKDLHPEVKTVHVPADKSVVIDVKLDPGEVYAIEPMSGLWTADVERTNRGEIPLVTTLGYPQEWDSVVYTDACKKDPHRPYMELLVGVGSNLTPAGAGGVFVSEHGGEVRLGPNDLENGCSTNNVPAGETTPCEPYNGLHCVEVNVVTFRGHD